MRDRVLSVVGWIAAAAAVVVMVVGLAGGTGEPLSDTERADRISANLRCPFCSGESIADATSQVARDLRDVVDEQVAAGMSDDEIYAYFTARYGDQILLRPEFSARTFLLWGLPALALIGGIAALLTRLRRRPRLGPPPPSEPPAIPPASQDGTAPQVEEPAGAEETVP